MKITKDYISLFLPLSYSFLLLCGIVKVTVYYKAFNIDILYYLDIGEILTIFFSQLNIYLIIIFFLILLIFVWTQHKARKQLQLTYKKEMVIISVFSGLLILALLFYLIIFFGFLIEVLFAFYSYILLILILIALSFLFRYYKQNMLSNAAFGIVILILILNIFSLRDIWLVKEGNKYDGVNFLIGDSLVTSDSNNYFIGKTNKYLFYHMSDSNITYVYPNERIKMISFNKILKTTY